MSKKAITIDENYKGKGGKYIVSVVNQKDDVKGHHLCNVNFQWYQIKLGVPVVLSDTLVSYFTNAEKLSIKGIDLKDEKTYVDIEKMSFKTDAERRFKLSKVSA
jgi:uncharacterized protein YbaR (Trm112 family)